MCAPFSRKSLYPKSGYSAELPAVDLTITARDETLLNTNNVLHPGVGPASNKTGGENNSEDENSALDDRNDDAGHEWSFQTEGFQYRTGFSRGLFHLLSNVSKLEPDEQEQSVDTKPLSEFHIFSLEKPISQVGI
nr:MAG TPA: hypothetical protein [Caudoviricetes sp.]